MLCALLGLSGGAQVINFGTCTQTVYVSFCGSTYSVTLPPGGSTTLESVSWNAAGCVYGGCFYMVSADFAKNTVLYKIYNPNGCCADNPSCNPPHVGDACPINTSGCNLVPPDDGPAPPCDVKCCGMPVWTVSDPDISLLVNDEPLGYQPAHGPRVSFHMMYYQREPDAGLITNSFSIGRRWTFSWYGKVKQQLDKDNNVLNVFNFSDGLKRTYINSSTIDYLTSRRLTGDFSSGFGITRGDGSRDFYGMLLTNNFGPASFVT